MNWAASLKYATKCCLRTYVVPSRSILLFSHAFVGSLCFQSRIFFFGPVLRWFSSAQYGNIVSAYLWNATTVINFTDSFASCQFDFDTVEKWLPIEYFKHLYFLYVGGILILQIHVSIEKCIAHPSWYLRTAFGRAGLHKPMRLLLNMLLDPDYWPQALFTTRTESYRVLPNRSQNTLSSMTCNRYCKPTMLNGTMQKASYIFVLFF